MPEISVIIPCYNVEKYIDRCLASITNQDISLDMLEIICVDDASTDSTWSLLQKWEQQYPENILLVHCEKNGRQGTARNIGMQYVNAPWVAFIDSDDWIEPDYFKILYAYASELNCDVVCCSYERDSSLELSYLANRSTGNSDCYLLVDTIEKRRISVHNYSMALPCWGKLIRTELLTANQIYFAENIAYEDGIWASLLHFYAQHIFILSQKLYHYYINEQSTVLLMDSLHHIDWITMVLNKWHVYEQRGFFTHYYEELEYEFVMYGFAGFIRTLLLRFTKPPYSLYLLMRQLTLEHFSSFNKNHYLQEEPNEYQTLVLQSLTHMLTKREFELFTQNARIYLAIHG